MEVVLTLIIFSSYLVAELVFKYKVCLPGYFSQG